jgi:hypothetical protein
MARVGGGGGAEPRRRRERSRSREESEVEESTSSSTEIGNQHPVFLDGEAEHRRSSHIGRKGHGWEWGIPIRLSGRPEENIIVVLK